MAVSERPAKKAKLLLSDDDGSPSGSEVDGQNGVKLDSFQINEEFAKRFEHNKKREEQHRLEEKFKNEKRKRVDDDDDDDEGDESEDDSEGDESEDDDAELATAEVDQEIMATLQAIRN
jgi:protein KRI1